MASHAPKPNLEKQAMVSFLLLLPIIFFVLPGNHESPVEVAVAQESSPSLFPVFTGDVPESAPHFVINTPSTVSSLPGATSSQGKYEYLQITEGCTHGMPGCIIARSGPGEEYDKVYELEKGMLLKVGGAAQGSDGSSWYKVVFDEQLRYPERTQKVWYVPVSSGVIVRADGVEMLQQKATTTKRIVVDLSDQMLYAYDGDKLFLSSPVSTGQSDTPTPVGNFTIYKKTPTRYMQGPLPGVTDIAFDLPGVPWDMYFTSGGAAIHGTYWHNAYGTEQSDGCVNIPVPVAKTLYDWAPLGTTVVVQK